MKKDEAIARRASPITYVNAGDPPMLLIQGTKDPLVPHDQAVQMVEAATKAGVPGASSCCWAKGMAGPRNTPASCKRRLPF